MILSELFVYNLSLFLGKNNIHSK